jgi:hypothetical protein
MTITAIIIVNTCLALLAVGAVAGIVRLAHRLSVLSPLSDERWGTGGDPWVPSAPLPLHQIGRHEDERAEALAA